MKLMGLMRRVSLMAAAALWLSGCTKPQAGSNGRESQSGLQNAAEAPSSASNFSADINFPELTPPAFVQPGGNSAGQAGKEARVLSGRLIPMADKEGKTVVGWRVIGELYNDGQQLFDNGQIMIGIGDRVLLAEPVQPGGFLPIAVGERMVYDTLIGEAFRSENVTISIRKVDTANPYIIIGVENIKFKKSGSSVILKSESASDEGSSSPRGVGEAGASAVPAPAPKFTVSGTIRNITGKSVTGLMVRFWVVSGEEVIAVGTWQAAQDVLASGQTRDFEAEITALTGVDQEKLGTGEVGLSAAGAGKPLN